MRNTTKIFFILLVVSFSIPASANLNNDYIKKYIPNAKKIGEANLSFFIWDVYKARLYAPEAKFSYNNPFVLKIIYSMDFSGEDIVDRSIYEIKKQGFNNKSKLSEWKKILTDIIPDVKSGTSLSGVYLSDGNTIFLKNGVKIGTITDKELSKKFFDIWLSEKTSAPNLRKNLLGFSDE